MRNFPRNVPSNCQRQREMITNAAHTTHRLVEEYNKLPTARDDTGKIRKDFRHL